MYAAIVLSGSPAASTITITCIACLSASCSGTSAIPLHFLAFRYAILNIGGGCRLAPWPCCNATCTPHSPALVDGRYRTDACSGYAYTSLRSVLFVGN